MTVQKTASASKRGKQNDKLIPHGAPKNPLFQAHRLEGKARNLGLKNIGPQMKKGKRGDR